MKGYIFDLDGVIVDTAKFHFLAWKKIGEEFGFQLTHELNEQLKGVSRVDSLQKILNWAGVSVSSEKFDELATRKNADYLTYVEKMNENDILPGVKAFLEKAKQENIKIALGSASKNARPILQKLGIISYFDAIVDGNDVTKAKPDPEVFVTAAKKLGLSNSDCVVFEDAEAGIEAAKRAGMKTIGIGSSEVLTEADEVFSGFDEILRMEK
ncbi:beta-phosphoglucomutase [Capnocytophaga stomatis]|uniref:Beta-phosphoglucomutase n=1 Tax=Capnocytophaga stomatis TaxID=1848904 RepID=A0ABW8QBX5_9FLAO|nr:beta-phosphoglucomutase [Capnocytophaga stomatis]GIJ93634.1 beta-phosphoglucomutase [Capnocytophaga stomatis]GIM50865.1 beta-phosphoglucomutase [Capnocytophaga stomatis]